MIDGGGPSDELDSYIRPRSPAFGGDWLVDLRQYIRGRKNRYMAKILAKFEEELEPVLRANGQHQEIEDFKGYVRQKMNALVVDINQVVSLPPDQIQNAAAVELRDRVNSG